MNDTSRPPRNTRDHPPDGWVFTKAVWDIDQQLAAVSNSFDYLLQLTPVNSHDAWNQFRRGRFERAPEFQYRPLPIDPGRLKRELDKIPIERAEDPALERLFQDKQEELALKITMLRDRGSPRFLRESLQLFGGVENELLDLATSLLDQLAGQDARRSVTERKIDASGFAERAEAEIRLYQEAFPEFKATTRITSRVSGLMVSRGRLLINANLSLPASRVEALVAHEVGTHLLTYYNGRRQPFQQLYSGLAGYEQFQEGLAVLAEYLVGGLGRTRMRQLAARVVAVRSLIDGATFVETFRILDRWHQFSHRAAYSITMRVYRGGGLTKDAVYLRGLREILSYVQNGGDLHPLFVGKIAVKHVPMIRELQYRQMLQPAAMHPRYLSHPEVVQRLERLRGGSRSVLDLVALR